MKKSNHLILLILIVLLSNCKVDNQILVDNPVPGIEIVAADGIVGAWEWTQTNDGGVTGAIHTPESQNQTRQLSLRIDGTLTRYENYIKKNDGRYRLKDTVLQDNRAVTMIRFNDESFSECQLISLNVDSTELKISNVCMVANSSMSYNRIVL